MAKRRSNNEGSIFLRKSDGRWVAAVSIEGRQLPKYFKTQKEARTWVKSMQDQVDAGLSMAGAQLTVADIFRNG